MTTPFPCILLDRPQLAENIGAVARVMANFGLSELRLIAPRDGWPQERAWPSASGADWPLDEARVFDTVEDAIADLHAVYATTARAREVNLPVLTPREAAAEVRGLEADGQKVGLLFGGERAGLETRDIALCRAMITIPIDPRFRSLNLAQAVAINAYEWRVAEAGEAPPAFDNVDSPPADQAAMQGLYDHLERELDASGFLHPPEKTPSMIRNLRAIFARAGLTQQEAATLRGVVTALSHGRGKVLEKLAAKKAAGDF
ncbi:MAG: RNA methyltransferase [Caulobacteraceae bacterium]